MIGATSVRAVEPARVPSTISAVGIGSSSVAESLTCLVRTP